MVVVTDKEAVLWADSRYHIQASQQLNQDYWTVMKSGNINLLPMVSTHLNTNQMIDIENVC